MSRFILVYQRYFGQANGIRVMELEGATDAKHADDLAKIKTHGGGSGYDVSYEVIEIADSETLQIRPRKLTWKERITGRVKKENV